MVWPLAGLSNWSPLCCTKSTVLESSKIGSTALSTCPFTTGLLCLPQTRHKSTFEGFIELQFGHFHLSGSEIAEIG